MMLPSVDLPAPFGPMIACTSPGFTSSDRPLRISRPATRAWRLSIFSISFFHRVGLTPPPCVFVITGCQVAALADGAFEAHFQQLLRLDRELHRQLAEHLLAEAV